MKLKLMPILVPHSTWKKKRQPENNNPGRKSKWCLRSQMAIDRASLLMAFLIN